MSFGMQGKVGLQFYTILYRTITFEGCLKLQSSF